MDVGSPEFEAEVQRLIALDPEPEKLDENGDPRPEFVERDFIDAWEHHEPPGSWMHPGAVSALMAEAADLVMIDGHHVFERRAVSGIYSQGGYGAFIPSPRSMSDEPYDPVTRTWGKSVPALPDGD